MLNKVIKVTLGLVFVALGIWTMVMWWSDVLALIRGGLGFAFILAGLVCFAVLD